MQFREKIAFKSYRRMAWRRKSKTVQGLTNSRGQPTRQATARVLPESPRSQADCSCRPRWRVCRPSDVLVGWRSPQASCRQQRQGYSDRTSERSRDLVGARVVCDLRGDEDLGWDGLDLFLGAGGGLLCARGRRTSRCVCSGRPVSREWRISAPTGEKVDNTAQVWVTRFGFRSMRRRVAHTFFQNRKTRRRGEAFRKCFLSSSFNSFYSNQMSKCLIDDDSLLDQSDANQTLRKTYWRCTILKAFRVRSRLSL